MSDSLKDTILDAALAHIAFDGWTNKALRAGARDAGLEAADVTLAFPGGGAEAVRYHSIRADERMRATLIADYHLPSMKIRERIATAVRVRLSENEAHKEAIKRGVAHYSMPWNMGEGSKRLWATVDAMWQAAGDDATDYNWYTKRGLLAKVYMTTLSFWLNDDSDEHADSWDFLNRRINDVMQIQKAKFKAAQFCESWLPQGASARR